MILLSTLYGSHVIAQGLEIGVYTEPQVTWITSDQTGILSDGANIHLNTGIEFDVYFMPNYAISLGLSLNNQGGKITYNDTTTLKHELNDLIIPAGVTMKHNLQYIGFPVGLKLKTEEMGYTTVYFHGGAIPMLNLRANTTSLSTGQVSLVQENIQPEINRFNFNYFVEMGIEYRLAGNTAIIAGFKWSAGFNDVTKSDFATNNLNSAGLHLGLLF